MSESNKSNGANAGYSLNVRNFDQAMARRLRTSAFQRGLSMGEAVGLAVAGWLRSHPVLSEEELEGEKVLKDGKSPDALIPSDLMPVVEKHYEESLKAMKETPSPIREAMKKPKVNGLVDHCPHLPEGVCQECQEMRQ